MSKRVGRKPSGACHIRERTLADGTRRYDVLARENGKQVTVAGGLKSAAEVDEAIMVYQTRRLSQGLIIPADTGIKTVRELGILYLAGLNERTRKTDARRWAARVESADFIDWPIVQLSEQAVRRWIDKMARTTILVGKAKGKKPERGTLATALAVLRSALKYAVIMEWLDRNVAESVTIGNSTMAAPKGTAVGDGFDYLHEDEVKRLFDAEQLPERQRTAFVLLAFTGARPKDLYTLTWDRVDVPGATVRYFSNKRQRHYTVHLLPQALGVIRQWWIRSGRPKTGLVFVGPGGEQHTDGYDWGWADTRGRRHFYWEVDGEKRHRKERAITTVPGWRKKIGIRRPLPLYSLRHTCASHLLLGSKSFTGGRRWSMEEVASQLGHADLSTVRRYAVALGIMSLGAVEDSRARLKVNEGESSSKKGGTKK